jgi:anti-sigma-K factor RskA
MTYQGWYIANGTPTSAGTMTVGSDGNIVATGLQPVPGTSVVAVTVEPDGGSDQPTSTPIIVGNLSATS